MSDELRSLFVAAAHEPAMPLDAGRIIRKGKRRRAVSTAAVALTFLAAAGVGTTTVLRSDEKAQKLPVAGPTDSSVEPAGLQQIAIFGIKAATDASLLEPKGLFADYRSVEKDERGSVVRFLLARCVRRVFGETCIPLQEDRDLRLTVIQEDGELAVSRVEGDVPQQAKSRLARFRSSVPELRPTFLIPSIVILRARHDVDTFDIKSTTLWLGGIPAGQSRSTCSLEVYGTDGEVIDSRVLPEFYAPRAENQRSGDLFGTSVRAKRRPSGASIACE